jgi:hypothetical protein
LPPAIDFDYVLKHASFLQNPTIYSCAIGVVSLYIILAVVMWYLDRLDDKRCGVTILADILDPSSNNYIYEIVFHTGIFSSYLFAVRLKL